MVAGVRLIKSQSYFPRFTPLQVDVRIRLAVVADLHRQIDLKWEITIMSTISEIVIT